MSGKQKHPRFDCERPKAAAANESCTVDAEGRGGWHPSPLVPPLRYARPVKFSRGQIKKTEFLMPQAGGARKFADLPRIDTRALARRGFSRGSEFRWIADFRGKTPDPVGFCAKNEISEMTLISPSEPCCATCSAPLEVARTGRRRRYCSHRCRTAAWRERDALRWSRYLDQLRTTLRSKGDTHDG